MCCLLVNRWDRPQQAEILLDSLGRPDEVVYKLGVDVHVPFVFGPVSSVVAEREDPPHVIAKGQGVGQALEDNVPILGAVPRYRVRIRLDGCTLQKLQVFSENSPSFPGTGQNRWISLYTVIPAKAGIQRPSRL